MALRVSGGTLALSIAAVAVATAAFRIYTAPERIQQRQELARSVCGKSGGQWIFDARRVPSCKRD